MKSLFVYLRDYRRECVLAPLFKLIEALLDLFVPLVMATIIDVGIAGNDRGYIFKMIGVLFALGGVGLAFSITAQYFAAKAATGFAAKLRHAVFERVQSFTFSQTDLFGTDTLITRMTSDINQVQSGTNMALRLFLRSPFIVFGAMLMAFTVDVRGALIFVVAIPILFIVVFAFMFWTMPLYRGVQNRLDGITRATRENLTGARVIRAFNQEAREKVLYHEQNELLTRAQKYVSGISALTNPVSYLILNAATAAILYTGAIRIDAGIMTSGEVIALVNYMNQILIELIKLANLIVLISRSIACGDRVADVLHNEPKMQDGHLSVDTSASTAVAFRDVSLRYEKGAGYALEHISFEAKRGQTIGIIGGTGSGKSSLVNLIPRFYDATEGEVVVFGENVRLLKAEALREKIGMVLQKAELFKGTIAENLRWGNRNAKQEDFDEALRISQAMEFVRQKEGQTEFLLEQNGRNLSGGQKQRLSIARALMKRPEILILDDSASALDFATDAKLRMAIRESSENLTTFIVSQRAASVQYADQILVLDDGRMVGCGTHDELLADNDIYREIYYSQFPKEAEDE